MTDGWDVKISTIYFVWKVTTATTKNLIDKVLSPDSTCTEVHPTPTYSEERMPISSKLSQAFPMESRQGRFPSWTGWKGESIWAWGWKVSWTLNRWRISGRDMGYSRRQIHFLDNPHCLHISTHFWHVSLLAGAEKRQKDWHDSVNFSG